MIKLWPWPFPESGRLLNLLTQLKHLSPEINTGQSQQSAIPFRFLNFRKTGGDTSRYIEIPGDTDTEVRRRRSRPATMR